MEILVLARQGRSVRVIARDLEISRKTVRRHLLRPETACECDPRPHRGAKLDPLKDGHRRRTAEAVPQRISATVLQREIRRHGYGGGTTTFGCGWPRSARSTLYYRQSLRDASRIPGACRLAVSRRSCAFLATAPTFVQFVANERLETFVEAHERFFKAAGVPAPLLYDYIKTVVVRRDAYGPGERCFNAGFRDFTKCHGFRPTVCHSRCAQTKGRVERFIRQRGSFQDPQEARLTAAGEALDVARANVEVSAQLCDVANVRTHRTTNLVSSEAFGEERGHLLPLYRPGAGLQPSRPSVLAHASVPQHRLSVYDEYGRAA